MDGSIKNNASKPLENQPIKSSPVQLCEDNDFCITENAATMNFLDPFNNEDNYFGVNNVLAVNPAQNPICANLLGNMEGKSQTQDQVMTDNYDNAVTGGPLFSNFWIPERARNSFNSEGDMVAGVQPQSLGRAANFTSHVHNDTFNSQDAMKVSSLYSNIQRTQVSINATNSRGDAEVQQHILGGTPTGNDTVSVHSFRGADFMSIPSQFTTFQSPQIVRSKANTGDSRVARVQILNQGGTATGIPDVHGTNSNDEIRFPSLFNNCQSQIERSSTNIGSNRHLRTQRNSRGRGAVGTSHVQGARNNGGNSRSVATQHHNMQSPQINRGSISIGGNGAAAIKPSSRGKTRTSRSHLHGVTIDSNTETSIPTVCSNLHGQQSNRSPFGIDGGLAFRMSTNNRDKTMDGPNLGFNAPLSNEAHSSLSNRNFLSVGGNIPEVEHSQVREKSRVVNNVKSNDNQSIITNHTNSAICSEEIDNSFLNLGFRGNTTAILRSNAYGRGISSNNGCPITTRSHTFDGSQTDGNFLSLGGDLVDQTWSNSTTKPIMSGTNSGVSSNPYMNLGGTIGNQTWSNNNSRIISGTNAGINSNLFTIPQMEQGNMHQYIPRPSGRTLVPGGNEAGYPNTVPYRGFHGHPGVALRPFISIPASLHANEQARLSSLPLRPSSLLANPGATFPTPLQQAYMNNARRITTNSSMTYPHSSTSARTFQQDQSGHPTPVNDTIAEAAKGLAGVYDNSKQAQTNQGTAHICCRGKRVPADGIERAQSAKVLLGPSISGKPVPVAGRHGLPRTSEGGIPTSLPAPRGRVKIPHTPHTVNPSATNVVYHIRWKDKELSYKSSGENCQLCKRDLTYTPTGPVTQPAVPPSVAVLPCRHTFHEECLDRITPADQSKDPPCIPCALGTL